MAISNSDQVRNSLHAPLPTGFNPSATIELPELPCSDAENKRPHHLLFSTEKVHASTVTVKRGFGDCIARAMARPFVGLANGFEALGKLIDENQKARKARNLGTAVSKFADVITSAADNKTKMRACVKLMTIARRTDPGNPGKAAAEYIPRVLPLAIIGSESYFRKLSLDLMPAAEQADRVRWLGDDKLSPRQFAAKNKKSATRCVNDLMLEIRGTLAPQPAEKLAQAEAKSRVRAAVHQVMPARKVPAMKLIQECLNETLTDPQTTPQTLLQDINQPAAALMSEYVSHSEGPDRRKQLLADLLKRATVDEPLPLVDSDDLQLAPELLSKKQAKTLVEAANQWITGMIGDGTEESARRAAARLAPETVSLLQMADETVRRYDKFKKQDTRLAAFTRTLFLRLVGPTLERAQAEAMHEESLQQEVAVMKFMSGYMWSAMNGAHDNEFNDPTAGMTPEVRNYITSEKDRCTENVRVFKTAVLRLGSTTHLAAEQE